MRFRSPSAALVLAAVTILAAHGVLAATVQDDFTYAYSSGPRTGIHGAGYFTFDPSFVSPIGTSTLTASAGDVAVTIADFGGQQETSGPFFVDEPIADFNNGMLIGIMANYVPPGATNNSKVFSINDTQLVARETPNGPYSYGSVSYVPFDVNVPEPASVALLGSSLLGLGLVRRRRKAT